MRQKRKYRIRRRYSTANSRLTLDVVSSIRSSGNVIGQTRLQSLHRRQLRLVQVPGRIFLSGVKEVIGTSKRKRRSFPRGAVRKPRSATMVPNQRPTLRTSTKTMTPRRTRRNQARPPNPTMELHRNSMISRPLVPRRRNGNAIRVQHQP
jgi:hypothetical protein